MALVPETRGLQGKPTVSSPFTGGNNLDVGLVSMRPFARVWNVPAANGRYRPELAWIGTESNEFGTDEFMKWCEVVGTEPYLCLNFGTGTLAEG